MLKFVHNTFLSETLKNAITIAQAIARVNRNPVFTPAHLLRGLLHEGTGLVSILIRMEKDMQYLERWANARIETCGKVCSLPAIAGDGFVTDILYEANQIRIQLLRDTIAPVYALAALSTPGVGFISEELKAFPLRRDELLYPVAENYEEAVLHNLSITR